MPNNTQEKTTALTAFDLMAHFVALRQNGLNRDDAWYQVCDAVPGVNEVTIKAFLNLAKNWERQEGHKYRYHTEKKDDTLSRSEVPVVKKEEKPAHPSSAQVAAPANVQAPPAKAPLAGAAPHDSDSALTGSLDPRKLRDYEQQQIENVLDQMDELTDDLSSHASTAPTGRTAPIGVKRDFFGPQTALLMFFKNYREPLRVTLNGDHEIFIGRMTSNTAMAPEVDLNIVGGGNYGVSRMHAAMTRRSNQLLIADLQSMNFTYINGVRLLPDEVRILQDGDEIWFGQLQCRIRFQHG